MEFMSTEPIILSKTVRNSALSASDGRMRLASINEQTENLRERRKERVGRKEKEDWTNSERLEGREMSIRSDAIGVEPEESEQRQRCDMGRKRLITDTVWRTNDHQGVSHLTTSPITASRPEPRQGKIPTPIS